jgi:cyclopropane fatty-acyl-phospholipid synthase-like methyltransferase
LKEGEEHLDFGCGWGALINFAAKNYGTKSTGITLS